jgi:hypothetical protein
MAVSASHAALPFPVKNARYSFLLPHAASTTNIPTNPTTPDTEVSVDGGTFADATEEVTVITGSNGMSLMTLTGAEMDASCVAVASKAASGSTTTLKEIYPRVLPIVSSGTARAGAAGALTLAGAAPAYDLAGCLAKTTGGTGGGGTGGVDNQARVITAYDAATKIATVVPNWETTPDVTTTYDILWTEMAQGFLRPATPGTLLDVDALVAALGDNVLTASMLAKAR